MTPTTLTDRRQRSSWEIQRAVLFALMLREFRTRVGGSLIGAIWMVAEPLMHVLVVVSVFGYLRHLSSSSMEFPVFLVAGLMPYFLFRNLAQRLTDAIDANRGLFAYRQVKPIDALTARGLVETVLWALVFLITLVLLGLLGFHVLPQRPLELVAVVLLCIGLGGSLGLVLAVTTHQMPRVRKAVALLYMPLYFGSGVIFSIEHLPPIYLRWLLWNPVLHVVDLSRAAFSDQHRLMAGIGPGYPAACALVLLTLGLALYRRDRQILLQGG
jgi:capsular polysaccharide transport system permease protein